MMQRSIHARLLAWSAGLVLLALALVWVALSTVLADFVNRRLEAELSAAARGVMAASGWDARDGFSISPPPADPRFERPLSGWYWQVSDGETVLARSPSLVTGNLGTDGAAAVGPDGAALVTYGEGFTAPGEGRALRVTVTLPAAESQAELAAVRTPLVVVLVVLALALMVAQVLAVRAGLVDLTRFVRAVAAVRDGRSKTLPNAQASELRPLAAELNRLLATNVAQLDRARTHAGDLAHALKTPLAVLANRAQPQDAALIERMDRTIRWHLKRARAGAAGLDPSARAQVAPVLEDLELVLQPEARRRGVALQVEALAAPDFRGDAEDLAEIIGALAENAVKWAQSSVKLAARPNPDGLEIVVTDDGPGIPEPDRIRILSRGTRLDEAVPGHGLGLAIAADRIAAYGGRLTLGKAEGTGLTITVTLPAQT